MFTYREETSFKQAQDHTTRSQSGPVVCEAHSDHDSAPSNAQASEENARADLTGEDSGRRLENDVCDEEDEGDDGLHSENHVSVSFPGSILPKSSDRNSHISSQSPN